MDPIEPWVDSAELRRMAKALLAAPAAPSEPPGDAAYGDDFIGFAATDPEPPQSVPPAAPPTVEHQAENKAELSAETGVNLETGSAAPAAPESSVPAPSVEQQARSALAMARSIAQRGGLLAQAAPENHSADEADQVPGAVPQAELTQVTPVAVGTPSSAAVSPPFVARLQAYGAWLREGLRAKSFFVTDRDGGVLIDEVQSPRLQQVARTLAQASRTANRQAGASAVGSLHIKLAPETVLEVVPVTTSYGPLILGIIVDQPISARNVETVAKGLQQVIDGNPGT